MGFGELWEALAPIGRDPDSGGYRRYSWAGADLACRGWFAAAAARRGMRCDCDRNGNLWAWWEPARPGPGSQAGPGGAVATGSHLDSVPDGGAFDGPLGVVSGFAAIDLLRERGFGPARRLGVAAFTEEEGARFGVACLGSRLLTGVLDPGEARALTDAGGVTLAAAMTGAGLDPARLGPDPALAGGLAAFVELHIEQGRSLGRLGRPVAVAESIWPHGRWRLDFTGRADHAGTTRQPDRRDPMLPYAAAVLAARHRAADCGGLATIGKVSAEPGAANAISSAVHAWLDARAPRAGLLESMVAQIEAAAAAAAAAHGVRLEVRRESLSPAVTFDPGLRERAAAAIAAAGLAGPDGAVPVLATGAGHDAGVLAAAIPAAMIFVRNPTGVSHSPAEYAEPADCAAGVRALAAVLAGLAGQ